MGISRQLASFEHLSIVIQLPLVAVKVLYLYFRYNSLGLPNEVLPPMARRINDVAPLFEQELADFHRVIHRDFYPVISVRSNVSLTVVESLGRIDVGHLGVQSGSFIGRQGNFCAVIEDCSHGLVQMLHFQVLSLQILQIFLLDIVRITIWKVRVDRLLGRKCLNLILVASPFLLGGHEQILEVHAGLIRLIELF